MCNRIIMNVMKDYCVLVNMTSSLHLWLYCSCMQWRDHRFSRCGVVPKLAWGLRQGPGLHLGDPRRRGQEDHARHPSVRLYKHHHSLSIKSSCCYTVYKPECIYIPPKSCSLSSSQCLDNCGWAFNVSSRENTADTSALFFSRKTAWIRSSVASLKASAVLRSPIRP